MTPNHDAPPHEPAPLSGLDSDPNEIEALITEPQPIEDTDGPIVVLAPRPWSPPAALVPAMLLLILAAGLMAYRAVGVEDWQGLFTEGRQNLLARAGWSNDEAKQADPPPAAVESAAEQPGAPPTPIPPLTPEPSPELATAEEPIVEVPAPLLAEPGQDEAELAEVIPPDDPVAATMDDIQKEAERRRAEQEELARLKEKLEAEAPPPHRGGLVVDPQQMLALMEQAKREQLEMMDRVLREMERQQPAWAAGGWGNGGFGAIPPLPGFDDVEDAFGFDDLRRRHAEAIERAERDMARFRERMGRGDPFFGRQPLAGDIPPPPAPGFDAHADAVVPPGLVVPEGAEVRTFRGPDGSQGFIMRWGWPPQGGGR